MKNSVKQSLILNYLQTFTVYIHTPMVNVVYTTVQVQSNLKNIQLTRK